MSSTEDLLIAQEIALHLRSDDSFSRQFQSILAAQENGDTTRPVLMISIETGNLFTRATRKGHIVFDLRSRAGDETDYQEHQIRVTALTARLIGSVQSSDAGTRSSYAAAKQALKDAVAAGGRVTLIDYAQIQPAVMDTDGEDLRTVIRIDAFWKLLPAA